MQNCVNDIIETSWTIGIYCWNIIKNMFNKATTSYNLADMQVNDLKRIENVPLPYREIFSEYPCFNAVQSKIFDDVFHTDKSIVISAPTGSGKTAIFELAIVKLLRENENISNSVYKIIYVSPIKALCQERLLDWQAKFSKLGISCTAVTGDTEFCDFSKLLTHNLIITTPEKWDSLTRRWKDNKKLVEVVKLFLIDEVHLLNEDTRGPTLEVIVSRMKTIENAFFLSTADRIRYIAVSASIQNIEDVLNWIGKSPNAVQYRFPDEMRPVPLKKIVFGYNYDSKSTPFKFDIALSYRLQSLLLQYSHGKPTLIFCSTRKSVEMTAKHIVQHITISLTAEQKKKLIDAAGLINDFKAKETLIHGVGYHHAGMITETKHAIETLFRNSDLPILVTTSTLAMGVNLPAHLVIIKSTKCYNNGTFEDYSETSIMQMIGRAGRPQFDTSATAIILTSTEDKPKYDKMVGGLQPIESHLHKHLNEHLNAEIVLGTITDLDVAMQWLSSTFLHIRARKNPRNYGIAANLTDEQIDRKLLEMCQIQINKLVSAGMLEMDQNVVLTPTASGITMAKYYVAFETMKLFTKIIGGEVLQQILALISKCQEFSEMYLRIDDKKCLNLLNKNKNKRTIRFPLVGKIKTLDMKINCIIQAVFGCLDIWEHSILADSHKIMRNGQRIVKCLIEYLETKDKCYVALLNSIILCQCFHAKLWENSDYVCKQLSGIGSVTSNQLVNSGKTSFQKILETSPRELEMITKKRSPFGNKMLEEVKYIPKYELKMEKIYEEKNELTLKITITLQNVSDLLEICTINSNSEMVLLVGDSNNEILMYKQYTHSYMIEHSELIKYIELSNHEVDEVHAHFISENWVGIDCNATVSFKANDTNVSKNEIKGKTEKQESNYMQMFMDMYMKAKKPIIKSIGKQNKNNGNASTIGPTTPAKKDKTKKKDSSNNEKKIQRTLSYFISPKSKQNCNENSTCNSSNAIQLENEKPSAETRNKETPEVFSDNIDKNLTRKKSNNLSQPYSFEDDHIFDNYETFAKIYDEINEKEQTLQKENYIEENINCNKNKVVNNEDKIINTTRNLESNNDVEHVKPDSSNIHVEEDNYANDHVLFKIAQKYKVNTKKQTPPQKVNNLSKRKFQIHPAMELENSLYEEKKKPKIDLQSFNYKSPKKLVHRESFPDSTVDSDPTYSVMEVLEPKNTEKTNNFALKEYEEKNQKSIKWRSPLVSPPRVIFSEKSEISNNSTSFESEQEHNETNETFNSTSSSNVTVQKVLNTSSKTKSPWRPKLTPKSGSTFPISDNECNSKSPTNSPTDDLNDVVDICSNSFIEDFCFPKPTSKIVTPSKTPYNLNSVTCDYYSKLMRKKSPTKRLYNNKENAKEPFHLTHKKQQLEFYPKKESTSNSVVTSKYEDIYRSSGKNVVSNSSQGSFQDLNTSQKTPNGHNTNVFANNCERFPYDVNISNKVSQESCQKSLYDLNNSQRILKETHNKNFMSNKCEQPLYDLNISQIVSKEGVSKNILSDECGQSSYIISQSVPKEAPNKHVFSNKYNPYFKDDKNISKSISNERAIRKVVSNNPSQSFQDLNISQNIPNDGDLNISQNVSKEGVRKNVLSDECGRSSYNLNISQSVPKQAPNKHIFSNQYNPYFNDENISKSISSERSIRKVVSNNPSQSFQDLNISQSVPNDESVLKPRILSQNISHDLNRTFVNIGPPTSIFPSSLPTYDLRNIQHREMHPDFDTFYNPRLINERSQYIDMMYRRPHPYQIYPNQSSSLVYGSNLPHVYGENLRNQNLLNVPLSAQEMYQRNHYLDLPFTQSVPNSIHVRSRNELERLPPLERTVILSGNLVNVRNNVKKDLYPSLGDRFTIRKGENKHNDQKNILNRSFSFDERIWKKGDTHNSEEINESNQMCKEENAKLFKELYLMNKQNQLRANANNNVNYMVEGIPQRNNDYIQQYSQLNEGCYENKYQCDNPNMVNYMPERQYTSDMQNVKDTKFVMNKFFNSFN